MFTEICLPLKAYVRQTWQVPVFQYLDDWLFFSCSSATLASVTRAFVQLCIRLELGVNFENSSLTPSTQLVHLGVEWNFDSASVRPQPSKSVTVATEATQLAESHSVTRPRLESFFGKLVALEKLVQYGCTYLRGIQALLLLELRVGRTFRWVTLTDEARDDMLWWSDRDRLSR